jgi:hypothetical protein
VLSDALEVAAENPTIGAASLSLMDPTSWLSVTFAFVARPRFSV